MSPHGWLSGEGVQSAGEPRPPMGESASAVPATLSASGPGKPWRFARSTRRCPRFRLWRRAGPAVETSLVSARDSRRSAGASWPSMSPGIWAHCCLSLLTVVVALADLGPECGMWGADRREGPAVAGPSLIHPAATGGSVARLLGRCSVVRGRPRRRWPRRACWLGPAVGAALRSGSAGWRW